jgi:hypothetical protein
MNPDLLKDGYRRIVQSIYAPNAYYHRVKLFLREFHPRHKRIWKIKPCDLYAAIKLAIVLGVMEKERSYYWRLLFWALVNRSRLFPLAVALTAYGFHFRKCFERYTSVEQR